MVAGKQVGEFVAEDGNTGRFQSDQGDAGFNLGFELVEDCE